MSRKKKVFSLLIFSAFTLMSVITLSKTASATIRSSADALGLINSTCPAGSNRYPELAQLKNEIAAAGTVNQAREMALAPTDGAIDTLKHARAVMPFSEDLRTAETRLNDARLRILVASSQAQVADEFSGMMLAGLDDDRAAHVSAGKVGCNYSSGEVIAIVIGLILGIIPGLILLVVLC